MQKKDDVLTDSRRLQRRSARVSPAPPVLSDRLFRIRGGWLRQLGSDQAMTFTALA
ncbi:Carbamoyl-phosphate synthase large chain, C-terminal section [Clarias magur]|uniref:Carbamoyl-phosphate synthase large chain, C-terminal section n=1 Tax=Clarias magur TaxID=1594786 RepID=A0A8J4TZU5_CLAMG|nr:Carbamoyl-phosphate synthase large chain, C-terminal section [Clarias magur]